MTTSAPPIAKLPPPARLLTLLTVAGLCLAAEEATADDAAERLLQERGIEPAAESIGAFLESLVPGEDQVARQKKLLEQLGDDDFLRREQAFGQLLAMANVSQVLLRNAAGSNDPEVAWRARKLLDVFTKREAAGQNPRLLAACLTVIRDRRLPGLAGPLLDVLPISQQHNLSSPARRALEATATPADLERLRGELAEGPPAGRVIAVVLLDRLLAAGVAADLLPLLSDDDDIVAQEAAWALVNRGRTEALATLAALLESNELSVRVRSAHALREVTGQNFGFVPFDSLWRRREAADKWRDWAEAHGPTAALKFPIAQTKPLIGRTLVCFRAENRVVEFDAQGREVWQTSMPEPSDCQGLPNGHRLIASYGARKVVEFNEHGDEVWRSSQLPGRPFSVRRLDNGHTLVACTTSRQVVEFDGEGRIHSAIVVQGEVMDARRLENGRTLVALQDVDQVVEVNNGGRVEWSAGNMATPRAAARLENGNTLIAQTKGGRIVELDPQGKVVWVRGGLVGPMHAQRLSNGNTLIAEQRGAVEVDRHGKVVWIRRGKDLTAIHRY